jgi:predicted aconitase with swiveling domain
MIIEHADPVLVSSALIFEVPMVHKVDPDFYNQIKDGDNIILNATEGWIEIT